MAKTSISVETETKIWLDSKKAELQSELGKTLNWDEFFQNVEITGKEEV